MIWVVVVVVVVVVVGLRWLFFLFFSSQVVFFPTLPPKRVFMTQFSPHLYSCHQPRRQQWWASVERLSNAALGKRYDTLSC